MAEKRISQSLNKAYRQLKIEKAEFDRFKRCLRNLYSQISSGGTEEQLKGDLMDFLKGAFYAPDYKVAPLESMDCVIHLGNNSDKPVGVVFEVKRPDSQEMISVDELNNKALQELLLYYLRERVGKGNFRLRQLVVTNINEYFIFDAREFERIFYSDKKLLKEFRQYTDGQLSSDKTEFFYKEIAAKYINGTKAEINYTHFDLRSYRKYLDTGNDKKLIELFKVFSPVHLLKDQFQNDSNTLNKNFYAELLYIMGLEEVEDVDSKKRIITRLDKERREPASIIENAITVLDTEDCLSRINNISRYGKNREEQIFNIALELSIGWINRVLFLKLLEAQMVKYHKGDSSYAFMGVDYIPDYDELNRLFFQVLARRPQDRSPEINEKYGKVPYLNSSLFEVSELEGVTIRISNLGNRELPLFTGTVLKEGQKRKYNKLPTLDYLLEFLSAYDFASEGSEDIQDRPKTLINASVLGLIFEKLNGHKDGSVFTPGSVTMYMCREVLRKVVVQKFNENYGWNCDSYEQLKDKEFGDIKDANRVIDSLTVCDPAVGSGHFLVSALNEIIAIKYDLGILIDRDGKRIKKMNYCIEVDSDELIVTDVEGEPLNYIPGNKESQRIQETLFNEKRKIIENSLFGVDINPNAVNICRLRLWIELLKNAYYTQESGYMELETLPNIDINIKSGNSLLHRFSLNQDISQILKKTNITIGRYKQLVYDYKNARSKETKRDLEKAIESIKSSLTTEIDTHSKRFVHLQNIKRELNDLQAPKLFGDDAKASMARKKRIAQLEKEKLKEENYYEEIRTNKMYIGAFEWRIEFPEVLDENGKFIGFDCVIGNPPYIQLQSMGNDADILGGMEYECFERKGDVYCLFYEFGLSLLRPNYLLSFITSNKWMRTEYGESTRAFLSSNSNPEVLIDFTGVKIFDAATVEVNVLTLSKKANAGSTISCAVNKNEFELNKMSDYVHTHSNVSNYTNGKPWIILSDIEKSIKSKVEAIGTPLGEWNIRINYGIKTGFNDAFIISTEKRDEILAACQSDEERRRTDEIIRPILRGRDIHRYAHYWANLWLIWIPWHFPFHLDPTIQGASREAEDAFKNCYPSIYGYLSLHKDALSKRNKSETGIRYEWYALQRWGANYLDDLSKQKIVWIELSDSPKFTICDQLYPLNTVFFLTGDNLYPLLGMLNSHLVYWYYTRCLGTTSGVGTSRWLKYTMDLLPLKAATSEELSTMVMNLIDSKSNGNSYDDLDKQIDNQVFTEYDLSPEEIEFLSSWSK